jgi:hypothetical protein
MPWMRMARSLAEGACLGSQFFGIGEAWKIVGIDGCIVTIWLFNIAIENHHF